MGYKMVILEEVFNSLADMQGEIIMRDGKLYTCDQLNSSKQHMKQQGDKVFNFHLINEEAELSDGDTVLVNAKTYNNEIHIFSEDACPPPNVTNRNICSKILSSTDSDLNLPNIPKELIKDAIDYCNGSETMLTELQSEGAAKIVYLNTNIVK